MAYVVRNKNKRRVYVTATDGKTRKSKHTTIYGATPKQVIDLVETAIAPSLELGESGRKGSNAAVTAA